MEGKAKQKTVAQHDNTLSQLLQVAVRNCVSPFSSV